MKIMKNIRHRFRRPSEAPEKLSAAGEGRFVGHKGQLEVVDDAIDHGEIGDKGDDLHRSPALGAG